MKRHRVCLQAGMTVQMQVVHIKPSGRMQSLNVMAVVDWQDMCKVKKPKGAGSGLQHACQRRPVATCREAFGHKSRCSNQRMSQLLQLKEQIAVTSVLATCLHRVAGNTSPRMRCCLLILIWVLSLRHCSAGAMCIETPPMVGALQSPICLYPAFRQRHQPAIHIQSSFLLIRKTTF